MQHRVQWYFAEPAGQYWKDLELIGKDATAFLTNSSRFEKGDSTNMVIFDIDETLLSNITPYVEYLEADEVKSPVTDANYTKNDFVPALQAIKDVYLAAYAHGMSVRLPSRSVTLHGRQMLESVVPSPCATCCLHVLPDIALLNAVVSTTVSTPVVHVDVCFVALRAVGWKIVLDGRSCWCLGVISAWFPTLLEALQACRWR